MTDKLIEFKDFSLLKSNGNAMGLKKGRSHSLPLGGMIITSWSPCIVPLIWRCYRGMSQLPAAVREDMQNESRDSSLTPLPPSSSLCVSQFLAYLIKQLIPQYFIMQHGEEQLDQATTSFEIIDEPRNEGETSRAAVETNNTTTWEEKERILERIE